MAVVVLVASLGLAVNHHTCSMMGVTDVYFTPHPSGCCKNKKYDPFISNSECEEIQTGLVQLKPRCCTLNHDFFQVEITQIHQDRILSCLSLSIFAEYGKEPVPCDFFSLALLPRPPDLISGSLNQGRFLLQFHQVMRT